MADARAIRSAAAALGTRWQRQAATPPRRYCTRAPQPPAGPTYLFTVGTAAGCGSRGACPARRSEPSPADPQEASRRGGPAGAASSSVPVRGPGEACSPPSAPATLPGGPWSTSEPRRPPPHDIAEPPAARADALAAGEYGVVSEARHVVEAGYDALGARYRDWSSGSPVRLRFVCELLGLLPVGSIVVDLGCGSGEPASRLLSIRHRVLGVDLSRVQLRLARQAAPGAALVRADMTEFALRPGSVDVVVSCYAFGHVPPAAHAPLLRSIAGWLRPGGLLLVNTPITADDETAADWLGVPMYFGAIGARATRHAVRSAGLHLDAARLVAEDEGNGHIVQFLWINAHERAETSSTDHPPLAAMARMPDRGRHDKDRGYDRR